MIVVICNANNDRVHIVSAKQIEEAWRREYNAEAITCYYQLS
jgi:hypothetical protein